MSTRWCCNTVKRNERRNEIRFSNRQHKIQKKTCINRHIIKYYVVTEHILIHGVAMETDFWRMRRSFADLPPLIHWPVTVVRASSTSAQSIRINRKHVSKETIAKNIKSFLQERERERERTRRETAWKWLAEILVYSPSFHNLCCQYLTGLWQGRPGCDYLLTSLSVHTGSFCECVCVHLSSRMTFPAFFCCCFLGCVWGVFEGVHPLFIFTLCLLPPWNVTCPWQADVSVQSPREQGCHGVPSPPVLGQGDWGCRQENAGPPTSPGSLQWGWIWWQSS